MSEGSRRGSLAAPIERSLQLGIRLNLGPVWWGASWAWLCGTVAAVIALALRGGVEDPGHLTFAAGAAWLASVPLLGAAWVPLLDPDRPSRRGVHVEPSPGLPLGRVLESAANLPLEPLAGTLGAVAVAGVIGLAPAILVAGALAAVFLITRWLGPAPVGWRRSSLEMGVPALVAWLAIGGPTHVPGPLSVQLGAGGVAWAWFWQNWSVLGVLAAFVVIHHGATAVRRRGDLGPRYRELLLGYGLAISVLAVGGSAWAAVGVALGFALLWPYQAVFRRGRVRWHVEVTQAVTMGLMLMAVAGAVL